MGWGLLAFTLGSLLLAVLSGVALWRKALMEGYLEGFEHGFRFAEGGPLPDAVVRGHGPLGS